MSVHISHFMPIKQVDNVSVLYYICELGKYSLKSFNIPLSVSGVTFNDLLKRTKVWQYFRVCCTQGYIVDLGELDQDNTFKISIMHQLELDNTKEVLNIQLVESEEQEDKSRESDVESYYNNPIKRKLILNESDNQGLFWRSEHPNPVFSIEINKTFFGPLFHQALASLLAYMQVQKFIGQATWPYFELEVNQNMIYNNAACLAYIIELTEQVDIQGGTIWFKLAFADNISSEDINHLKYTSWHKIGTELNLLKKEYSPEEKVEYLKALDLEVGDVVFFYTLKPFTRTSERIIKNCQLAVIRGIYDTKFCLEIIHTVKLKSQAKLEFDNCTTAVKALYTTPPYENIITRNKTFDFYDIGIQYMSFNENHFIMPVRECEDVGQFKVSNNFITATLTLDQRDYAYWLLEDYNVDYNRDKYLEKVLEGYDPVRDIFFAAKDDTYYLKANGLI